MPDTKLVGAAGEHWVCSVLAGLGWSPSLTRDGVARTDVLAENPQTGDTITIQVKTCSHGGRNWPLNKSARELARSPREWFVFVRLDQTAWDSPTGYVVPRNHVVGGAYLNWRDYRSDPELEKLGRRSGSTWETPRLPSNVVEGYRDKWDLLNHSSNGALVLLPQRFKGLLDEYRSDLPEHHPWKVKLPRWGSTAD